MGQGFSSFVVPFFYITSVCYFARSLKRETSKGLIQKQWLRIICPFLCWSLLYLLLFETKDRLGGRERGHDWIGILFYGQSAVHLYFLPVLVWMNLSVLSGAALLGRGVKQSRWGALSLALLIAFAGWGYHSSYMGWTNPFLLEGFILAGWMVNGWETKKTARSGWTALLGGILWVGAIGASVSHLNLTQLGPLTGICGGLGFYLLVNHLPWAETFSSASGWLTTSYGVYLSHFAILEGMEFFLQRSGHSLQPYSLGIKLLLAGVIFLLAMLFTLLARKHCTSRKLLLGE